MCEQGSVGGVEECRTRRLTRKFLESARLQKGDGCIRAIAFLFHYIDSSCNLLINACLVSETCK